MITIKMTQFQEQRLNEIVNTLISRKQRTVEEKLTLRNALFALTLKEEVKG
jgi:hypothetical protein